MATMSEKTTNLWTAALEAEKLDARPDAIEKAFDMFIIGYQAATEGDREQFRARLPFAYNSRGLARWD